MTCCGHTWVGPDRAHCCRRTAGCGHVFDTPHLFDSHRVEHDDVTARLDPNTLDLTTTKNGIWIQP
ncbi:hypothetical protein Ae168Ps1_6135 [Pseudonocardia sp. Ae168_Ps1]|uniref:FDXHR family putative zinc-binding protein n=1 Tax=unclassified Pseudonocardia TaxID=2619320 RepID=UPI00094B6071|nr:MULTISPECIES: hypothetical protein [unclassified Pseudonocardia]OLL70266.1 hypothetical protein Ae150APs1_6069 [Pseudonocardia sp. Ae150A_Ps1]OLL70539.1 hypothetical protein Ae263Ps1_6289 [Pseudonocardia sp. Ae263_Ps1]OLL70670.1 hypothetical protein Ae168Ps1_6135 [Pseudonocardia sp. Ae168_Ps1]OLL89232.1 hypothetical protein Ae356Ps1_6151c [Pseudonocardia sp. Ae356_Ps1]